MAIDTLEAQLRDFKKKNNQKTDQLEVMEKEYGKMQEKVRDSQNTEFNIATLKDQ